MCDVEEGGQSLAANVFVGGLGDREHWRLTFFYGFSAESDRYNSWPLLERLYTNLTLPCCCVGDFN